MKTVERRLLAASPYLGHPNLARAVVLVLHHSDDGAFGVVLNRLIATSAKHPEKIIKRPCSNGLRVYLGGPVPCRLMAIHNDQSLAKIEAWPGHYTAATRTTSQGLEQTRPVLVTPRDSLAQFAVAYTGRWPADNVNPRLRKKTELVRLTATVAFLRE